MRVTWYLVIGLLTGSVSGALGIGGGVVLVPLLMWAFGGDQLKAQGTSLAVFALPIGLLPAWRYYQRGQVEVGAAFWIALALAAGATFVADKVYLIPLPVLRTAFGLGMMFVAVRMLLSTSAEAEAAAAGLIAVAAAWAGHLALAALGRRHRARPSLGDQIRAIQERQRHEVDYSI